MTIYYRVNLQVGIVSDKQEVGFYSKSPELGITVFKHLRAAKRKFDEISTAEVNRIKSLRKVIRAIDTREQMLEKDSHETPSVSSSEGNNLKEETHI